RRRAATTAGRRTATSRRGTLDPAVSEPDPLAASGRLLLPRIERRRGHVARALAIAQLGLLRARDPPEHGRLVIRARRVPVVDRVELVDRGVEVALEDVDQVVAVEPAAHLLLELDLRPADPD